MRVEVPCTIEQLLTLFCRQSWEYHNHRTVIYAPDSDTVKMEAHKAGITADEMLVKHAEALMGTRGILVGQAVILIMGFVEATYNLNDKRISILIRCRRFDAGGTSKGAPSVPPLTTVQGRKADPATWRFSPLMLTWVDAVTTDDPAALAQKYVDLSWNTEVLAPLWPSPART